MNLSPIHSWITSSPAARLQLRRFSFINRGSFLDSFRPSFDRKARMQRDKDREALKHSLGEFSKRPPRTDNKHKPRLRGHPKDEADVRVSKTLSWLLRHGAKQEGLVMRQDGYVRVQELLALPRMEDIDFQTLERLVQHDAKERYHLLFDASSGSPEGCWWIRANQGHSIQDVDLHLAELTDAGQIPMAVHGTTMKAWAIIQKEGLSPMKRTHIHLAQHFSHIKGAKAIPGSLLSAHLHPVTKLPWHVPNLHTGLRNESQVLIHIDLDRALHAGIPFFLSANGVVLSKGDGSGFIRPEFFKRVTDAHGKPLPRWSTGGGFLASEKDNCNCNDVDIVVANRHVSGGECDEIQPSSIHSEAQPGVAKSTSVASETEGLANVVKNS